MKHIITKAIITKDNKIIPFWELHPFEYFEDVNNVFYNNNNTPLQDVIYNLENKTLSTGILLEYNKDINDLEYKIGEECYFETVSRKLSLTTIKDILFENFTSYIMFGEKVGIYWKNKFKDVKFEDEELYHIIEFSPTYILEDNTKVENPFKLFKKYDNYL